MMVNVVCFFMLLGVFMLIIGELFEWIGVLVSMLWYYDELGLVRFVLCVVG